MQRSSIMRIALIALCVLVGSMPASAIQPVSIPHMPHVPAFAVQVSASGGEIKLNGPWKFQLDPADTGIQKGWSSPKYDDSAWKQINVPGDWESQGYTQANPSWSQSDDLHQPYTGYAWYRKTVVIPAEWKGRSVVLNAGKIDDLDWTYVNGSRVGSTTDRSNWPSAIERTYTIPSDVVKWGQPNVIAIRVLDYRGLGGMREGPVSLSSVDVSGPPAITTSDNDAVKIGGSITVQAGQTVKNAVAVGGSVNVYGHVMEDAVAIGGTVHVYPGGAIDGDAVAIGGQVVQETGATIRGSNESIGGLPWNFMWPWEQHAPHHGLFGSVLFGTMIGFAKNIVRTLLALLIVALFLSRTEIVARAVIEKPGWSILYGFLVLLLVIPVGLFLLVTCIGIPLILVEAAILILAKFLGFTGLALAIGWKLGEGFHKPVPSPMMAVLIGGLALSIIGLVPFLGGAVDWVLRMFGFGAVFITGFGSCTDWIWSRALKVRVQAPPSSSPPLPPAG